MGVKSLWQLLDPVGRPVLLETMEGKSMAIDSSIWIYQFQATMRDKEGRGLMNAHVLGFLRRICKLLFYGIKPVFVFDGGAPTLKMSTIAERKKKKSGAAASHAKVAERLLAAQMRREALDNVAGKPSKSKGRIPSGPARIDENTIYLEDIAGSGPGAPKTPAKPAAQDDTQSTPPSSSKKARWRDHDPYKLPEVNMDEVVAKATATAAPDPRLATEDELRAFIEEMRPEDFDVGSSAFRELPTEVQYEIIGDLRLKSRQTSYKRLQSMLRIAKTPLDFSKEQIKNLKQRNALTQQLLVTTDSVGKAHIAIPVRIASERNKEYVLIKNESEVGGWVLGIRDDGTAVKPIEIDPAPVEVDSDDEDDDMEDVSIAAAAGPNEPYDPDLREYRRQQALAALADRYSPKKLAPLATRVTRKPNAPPLFEPEEDELPQLGENPNDPDDPELVSAIQESIELEEEASLRRAMEESRMTAQRSLAPVKNGESSGTQASPERHRSQQFHAVSDESDDEDLYASPTRLETALSIAGAGPHRPPVSKSGGPTPFPSSSVFGVPSLLLPQHPQPSPSKEPVLIPSDSGEDDMEEVTFVSDPSRQPELARAPTQASLPAPITPIARSPVQEAPAHWEVSAPPVPITDESDDDDDDDDDMEQVQVAIPPPAHPSPPRVSTDSSLADHAAQTSLITHDGVHRTASPTPPSMNRSIANDVVPESPVVIPASDLLPLASTASDAAAPVPARAFPAVDEVESSSDSEAEPDQARWSRSPSPSANPSATKDAHEEGWDAAQEMDPHAEEDEYTRFLSQMKGKDIDSVRREIDDEIRELNKQKKNAMRDSEDITQQMISQIMIMLRLFGIPYITAPMEAEAQCAVLLSLGLVDGIITDDSDVFLFGGGRVLKNMFNQSKTVECYLAPDLERELGLDRDKLVRLAYLLGSDYTDGVPGVGPVVAMELLSEFPGVDGLHKFKQWWIKVQSGRDKAEENASRFRKRFKKKFKELYLPAEWPNPAVRDAYYHPTVDESTEPFKWGFPDLDALRGFFNSELGWDQTKNASTNAQGNLAGYFDLPVGVNAAPRKRQAYTSKRLQQVVSDFRKQQARQRNSATPSLGDDDEASDSEPNAEASRPAKKRKKSDDRNRRKEGAEGRQR
ncbi:PIN domain-like protein [Ganoderma leucocontextum]|nr:PIN domain-like protein [Ganoderma leucocontextum]